LKRKIEGVLGLCKGVEKKNRKRFRKMMIQV
jgi:hypothetical protein